MIYRPASPLSCPRGSELSFAYSHGTASPLASHPCRPLFLLLSSPPPRWPSSSLRRRDRTPHRTLLYPFSPVAAQVPRTVLLVNLSGRTLSLYFIRSSRNAAERPCPPSGLSLPPSLPLRAFHAVALAVNPSGFYSVPRRPPDRALILKVVTIIGAISIVLSLK